MNRHWLTIFALIFSALCNAGIHGDPGRWDHHGHRRSNVRRYNVRFTSTKRTTTASTTTTTTTTATTALPPSPATALRDRRRSWRHSLGWTIPAERCQIPADFRTLPKTGLELNSNYIDHVKDMLVEDKSLLAPIVFEGAMVSRTNTFKSMYFVSFKVFRVIKGNIQLQQLQGQVRLLFRTQLSSTKLK